jgi:hypothetical protein
LTATPPVSGTRCWLSGAVDREPGRCTALAKEDPVALVAHGRRTGTALLDRRIVLPGGIGPVDDPPSVVRRGEAHRSPACHVLTLEAELFVPDLSVAAVAMPVDVKAHVRGNRLRPASENRVDDVVVVLDLDVARPEPCPPGGSFEADRRGRDRDRPEQPGTTNPRLPVVPLM